MDVNLSKFRVLGSWPITRVNNTVKSGNQKLAEVRQEFSVIIKVCRWQNSSKHLIYSAVCTLRA